MNYLRKFAMVTIAATCCGAAAHAEGWARFRGDSAAGVAGHGVPSTWSDTENLAWSTELPGKGSSSPVVYGDKVFLTAHSGYGIDGEQPGDRRDLRLHVICLSLTDGRILWDEVIDPAVLRLDTLCDDRDSLVTRLRFFIDFHQPNPCQCRVQRRA